MKQQNILYGIIGLLLGLILGFFGANYINRNSAIPVQAQNNDPSIQQTAPQIPQPKTGGGAAVPEVQAAIEKAKNEPDNFDAQKQAGLMYYNIGRMDEALKFFTVANRINPEDFDTNVKIGNINFDAGKFVEAEKFYTAALKQKPSDVDVRTDMGLTFFFRQPRDIDRAIAEYRKSLEYKPDHELTLQNLCAALKEKGDTAALAEAIKKLEAVNPQNAARVKLKQ
jgi:tetratricopeptide (TPR) repeat protein